MTSFKTDENLPREAAELLRAHAYDALSVLDQNLGGRPDSHISSICKVEARVLMTLDLDFANIRVYPPEHHAGIVVLRCASQDKSSVMAMLTNLLPLLANAALSGQLWIVEPDRVRIWQNRDDEAT